MLDIQLHRLAPPADSLKTRLHIFISVLAFHFQVVMFIMTGQPRFVNGKPRKAHLLFLHLFLDFIYFIDFIPPTNRLHLPGTGGNASSAIYRFPPVSAALLFPFPAKPASPETHFPARESSE